MHISHFIINLSRFKFYGTIEREECSFSLSARKPISVNMLKFIYDNILIIIQY